jgi:citrate lyase subunit beta/citryl-CoA lyase
MTDELRPRRSVPYMPAANDRALEKAQSIPADAIIFDLEDAVAPDAKPEARAKAVAAVRSGDYGNRELTIRCNGLDTQWGADDVAAAGPAAPSAVVIPKVDSVEYLDRVSAILDDAGAPAAVRIWAMIETPRGILNAAVIAAAGRMPGSRLDCLVVGLNDLRKETGVLPQPGRSYLVPWLMQVVLAVSAYGLDAIDSVFNDFRDEQGFDAECLQGRAMGFAGKMLIHPAQIEPANRHFSPDPAAIAEAKAIISAFADPASDGLNVINAGGRMVERLHLVQAESLVHKARLIAARQAAARKTM